MFPALSRLPFPQRNLSLIRSSGWMEVGDEVTLVERKYPDWTIERVQEYLHRDKDNLQKLMEVCSYFGSLKNSDQAGSRADSPHSWKKSRSLETSAKMPSRAELQNLRPKKRRKQTAGRRKSPKFGKSSKLSRRKPKLSE
jgi:hypothetical protein